MGGEQSNAQCLPAVARRAKDGPISDGGQSAVIAPVPRLVTAKL